MRRPRIYLTDLAALAVGSLLLTTVLLAAGDAPFAAPPPGAQAETPATRESRHLTPIEYFRGLLAMNPVERDRELARKTPADRAVLMAKLREYQALPREIREARLCQTELHWELSGLMKLPPDQRAARLKEVSPLYMPMFNSLLREWDQLPAETRKVLLEKESFIGAYLQLQGSSAVAQRAIRDTWPVERRAQWGAEMERWLALPAAQRTELCAQFQHFCQLSPPAREETALALSDAERQEMEATLREFDRLPAAQREMCINSFRKFATMSQEERAQFLKNAARWDAMAAGERQLWRELVHTLPPMPPMPANFPRELPPMPPGFHPGAPPMPPMPPNVTTPVVVAQSPRT
jgi:hypothetical protein